MSEFVPYIMIGGLVTVYILTYMLNKKTPIPEECRDLINDASCTSCHNFSCSHHQDDEE